MSSGTQLRRQNIVSVVRVGVARKARSTFASELLHGLERRDVLRKDPVVLS